MSSSRPACTTMRPVGIAGVHFRSSGTVARLAGFDVDDAQLVERLVEDVPRVALPAWRVRALGGHAARRPERLAAARHRPDRQHPFVDRGHLGAVGRPRRTGAAARVDRQHRDRRVPLHRRRPRPRWSAPGWCPRGTASSAARRRRARRACRRATRSACPAAAASRESSSRVPLARSSTDISATRHMPSTLKNTMRLPSGENDAPCGCVVRLVTWRLWPLFMSRIQSCRSSLSLSDEYTSCVPSGDHAGSVSSAASLVMLTGLPRRPA